MPDESLRVPIWCPMCKLPMKGTKSDVKYYQYGCCMTCFIQFIEDREERWKSGWRPTQEEIDRYVDRITSTETSD